MNPISDKKSSNIEKPEKKPYYIKKGFKGQQDLAK